MAKLKTKDVAVLSHNQSCNSSLFKVSFLEFADAIVMCIIKYCHSHDQRASLESTLQNENMRKDKKDEKDERFLIKTVPNCKNIFGSELD